MVGLALQSIQYPTATASDYWSSTTFPGSSVFAWGVGFNSGFVLGDDKSFTNHVRAVRGGSP